MAAPGPGAYVHTRYIACLRKVNHRVGLSAIASEVPAPAHLIEVGASAGLIVCFDRYGYTVGGRSFGNPASPVQLVADHYGTAAMPDLDTLPDIATVQGVDLNPSTCSTLMPGAGWRPRSGQRTTTSGSFWPLRSMLSRRNRP